jgi:hypothetical protein
MRRDGPALHRLLATTPIRFRVAEGGRITRWFRFTWASYDVDDPATVIERTP